MRIGKTVVMLNPGSKLFAHHLMEGEPVDFSKPLAEVGRHPTDATRLKNLTGEGWTAVLNDGAIHVASLGNSVALAAGTCIQFGQTEGEIWI